LIFEVGYPTFTGSILYGHNVYTISAYYTNVFEFHSWRCQCVLDTILQCKVCYLFMGGQMLSPDFLNYFDRCNWYNWKCR